MANENEPRALGAALAAPAFVTRGHSLAVHAADRHVERWAPEASAGRVRSMRSLGFVDRLVAPWIETAQRSASLRLFNQYVSTGLGERAGGAVSWVFPRPWYQDELDWMASARRTGTQAEASRQVAPTMLTTRGTYVAPSDAVRAASPAAAAAPSAAAPRMAMPAALYEYIAPSLSLAANRPAAIPGVGFGGDLPRGEAYSPLVPLAAVQAAELMTRAIAPLAPAAAAGAPAGAAPAMTPGLRSVLSSILARAAAARAEAPAMRIASLAPTMVTPPAPRDGAPIVPGVGAGGFAAASTDDLFSASASQVAEQYAARRVHVAELQRIAQLSVVREQAAREAAAAAQAPSSDAARAIAAQGAVSSDAAARAAAQAQDAARAATARAAEIAAARTAQAGDAAAARIAAQAAEAAAARATAEAARARTGTAAQAGEAAASAELRAAAERAEAELRQRAQTGATNEVDAARAADVERARAALAPGGAAGRAEALRLAEAATASAAERARIEERVAQRVAERGTAQRLHEHARAEAAAHVRTAASDDARRAAPAAIAPSAAAPAPVASAEVTAAIAGLPPELAALLGSVVSQRPERAVQAISELHDTLRTVELLARSSASGAAFQATRGPRLVMPAGLGGLVSAVDRAQSISERPAMLGGRRPLAPLAQFVAPPASAAAEPARAAAIREASAVRVPSLAWLTGEPGAQAAFARGAAAAPTTALGATAAQAPAALSHVAWADRWLARFAGAAPQSLDMITAAGAATPGARMRALASAAPGTVFVVPDFLRGDAAADAISAGAMFSPAAAAAASSAARVAAPVFAPAAGAASIQAPAPAPAPSAPPTEIPGMTRIEQAADVQRFDDNAETPDDVFAAISAAASRRRPAARPAAPAAPVVDRMPATPVIGSLAATAADRAMPADLVAHAAPSAPGAGLSAQLASSPFAPALRHVISLPSAPSFDIRALFGASLGAEYLAGLIGPASHELSIGAQTAPAWAAWSEAPLAMLADRGDRGDRIDRLVPGFDAAYVRPEAPPTTLTDELGVESTQSAFARAAVAAPGIAPSAPSAALASSFGADGASFAAETAAAAELAERLGALTTLRTALLSWEVAATSQPGVAAALQLVPASFASAPSLVSPAIASYRDAAAASAGAARRMVESMTLPMLGQSAEAQVEQPAVWSAPGMLAERAHTWSVAQERSASDLALDFVSPELVLAARVYGLGPAEAAQAARLAIAGPGQLGAMASTVDRTFVEALAIGRDARLEAARPHGATGAPGAIRAPGAIAAQPAGAATAAPFAAPLVAPSGAPLEAGFAAAPAAAPAAPTASEIRAAITTAFPTADGAIAAAIGPVRTAAPAAPSTAAFGVDRRAPRGAFLWPSASVAALGLNAAAPDGQLSMSVAALELLAAQVVAELGTFTALSDAHAATLGIDGESGAALGVARPGAVAGAGSAGDAITALGADRSAMPVAGRAAMAQLPGAPGAQPGRDASPGAVAGREPAEADVLGAAAALIPVERRARFEALYVALGQSPSGLHWSPAARAARALALAARGDEGAGSARARAASAWDVLPVVYGGDAAVAAQAGAADPTASTQAALASTASASANAAIAEAMSTHVAPSWLGGPRPAARGAGPGARGPGARGPGARGPGRAGGAPGRDFVAPQFGEIGEGGDAYVSGPGLSGLASRAGEALGSYIMPAQPPAAPRDRQPELTSVGAVLRAPTAAPEYVQTGRSAGRYGGGEPEIPPWFEAAARKMLAERGDGDGISLAELTLVTAAPASHVAASTRSAPSASPAAPSSAAASQQPNNPAPQIDIEKLATEVYRNILVLMDVARARNGDPHL
jgi:hypothetical protein